MKRIEGDWLAKPSLRTLFDVLGDCNTPVRVNGGAVRNALLGEPVADVDISTPLLPAETMRRLKAAGHKAVPTGLDHGTVTAVVDGDAYEVTTLRRDVETDGRRAVVAFTTDWREDALRRDLTMNALYCDPDGAVFDPLDGLSDVERRVVRFVEDADRRIREDRLRILRFFRFFAWYGQHRPDADGLKACARQRDGIAALSAERIWAEFSKLLAAPDPTRAVLWMRQTSVLKEVLPEGDKWGIDNLAPLIAAEVEHGWKPDAMLRLMAILPPAEPTMAALSKRLKLPNLARDRLKKWSATPLPPIEDEHAFARTLYRADRQALVDRLRLAISKGENREAMLVQALTWERPTFPLRGADLIAQGMDAGPEVSKRLAELEERWINSDFKASGESLLEA
ncbi:CCA tRNA nucleotidyltransferase [Rhizobiaceae bacterium]|nr:CCA tRNA nucleotidyltransferase [Rhizobiaceae bacterium]